MGTRPGLRPRRGGTQRRRTRPRRTRSCTAAPGTPGAGVWPGGARPRPAVAPGVPGVHQRRARPARQARPEAAPGTPGAASRPGRARLVRQRQVRQERLAYLRDALVLPERFQVECVQERRQVHLVHGEDATINYFVAWERSTHITMNARRHSTSAAASSGKYNACIAPRRYELPTGTPGLSAAGLRPRTPCPRAARRDAGPPHGRAGASRARTMSSTRRASGSTTPTLTGTTTTRRGVFGLAGIWDLQFSGPLRTKP